MGWTFTRGASKEKIMDEILEPWDTTATEETAKSWYGAKPAGTRTQSIVLAYRCVGDSLWYVRETTTTKPDGTVTVEKWIGLSLLEKDGSYGWGHKDMEESMGPYDDTCPVEFLDMAPQPEGEFCGRWREAIRRKSGKIAVQQSLFAPQTLTGMEPTAAEQ